MAYIYCITNKINNKKYIGKTDFSLIKRFREHINDTFSKSRRTENRPLYRAIRKYGPQSFKLQVIDNAETQEELNLKEQYWIRFYDSVNKGYNETDAISKCGGNTYQSKTKEEMSIIKDKIRQTKLGAKNPMARKVKRINIKTGEIDVFDTVIACAKACGIKEVKTSISTRLNGKVKSPFKNTWIFEYYEE
jgi:group I intron endonuclease